MNLANQFKPFSPPETNFLERLQYWALAQPEALAFRFLVNGEDESIELTYAELDQRARALAAKLVSMGYAGQRALMMYPSGMEFVIAFFACHYAGVVPVPAYPPRRNRNMARINAISEDVQASVALTISGVIKHSRRTLRDAPRLRQIPWVPTEEIPAELASDWICPRINNEDLALIQYTSGSTGSPKGVMLTQANLIANCAMITKSFDITRDGGGCSWLPLYHDMGLVGGVLNPLFFGVPNTFMSPVAFLTKPIRWLRAISQSGATISGGPNFAFAWCTMKIDHNQCKGLDLSRWEVAFNGAEPVRADVMEAFTKKFQRYGFRAEAHYPCYGLAETTLFVTGGDKHTAPVERTFDKHALVEHRVVPVNPDHDSARRLVGCGRVCPGEEVIIVHPESRRKLADDQIGEIWINSPSSGQGYWNKPKETSEVFNAHLKPDNGRRYVRSGDLGFMDKGELFVTGRLKDMIIVRGVNRYPQDIESTVEHCNPLLRSGGSAAFAVEHWDREHLVVVCEVQKQRSSDWSDLIRGIRAAISEEHDLPPDAIVLVRAHSIPKTSSGKVQRHACRQHYIDGELMEVARWSALAETDQDPTAKNRYSRADQNGQALALNPEIVNAVMHYVRHVGKERAKNLTLDTNIVSLGLDSLERLDIAQSLQTTFGGRIPDEVLQEVETIREVAEAIETHIGISEKLTVPDEQSIQIDIAGPIPESYYQLEKMPEYVRLQRMKALIESTGIRNPYFTVHEGTIRDTTQIDGRQLVSFASYNYLGLSGHPDVNQAAKNAIDQFGTSVSASRIVSGEKTIHKELERELSEFLGVEDVITFPGGHATNESVIGHLVGSGDLILHDSYAHNSIIQGAELSGARRRPFEHNNWQQLDSVLSEVRNDYRRVLICIEGLYSMDGDYPELPRFVEIKKRHRAWMFIDEAHSIGTLGTGGRGLGEVFNVKRQDVECWMGTFSKSLGSCGGFVGGSQNLIEYLRYTTPGYVFAAGMPPANVGAALGALRIMRVSSDRVARLQQNARLFLELARAEGLNTGTSQTGTPIIPIVTGSSIKALQLSEGLFNCGINAQPILHPAVAEDQARVRIFITSLHTEQQIRSAVEIIARQWQQIVSDSPALPQPV